MPSEANVRLCQWLTEPLTTDIRQAIGRLAKAEDVQHIAVMPDVHLAENVCVGIALATERVLFPDAVGGDIGCGMSAVRLDGTVDSLARAGRRQRVLDAFRAGIACNRRDAQTVVVDVEAPVPEALSAPELCKLAQRDGRVQLGTLGSGNHFVELQADEQSQLWLMVHSGSRAMGPAIRQHHLGRAAGQPLRGLPAESDAGAAYLADAQWAMAYAAASRRALLASAADAVAEALGITAVEESQFDCCHNMVRLEEHFGRMLYVHRKGAMPAGEGELGIIPGSMGTESYHVSGRGFPDSLCSSSHGAGRRLSRSQARSAISLRDLQRQMGDVMYDPRVAHLLRDEAPKAYRDIRKVMRAQADLTRIARRLTPLISFKGV